MWPFCLPLFTQHIFKVHSHCSVYRYFLFIVEQYSTDGYTTFYLSTSGDGLLCCFQFLVIIKQCCYEHSWISSHVNVCFQFSLCRTRNGMSGISGSYNFTFNYLRNCRTVFQRRYNISYFHQQCIRPPISSHPSQHLLLFFLITAILVSMMGFLLWSSLAFFWWPVTLNIFSWAYWPFVYFIWRNVYSNPLHIW